MKGYAKPLNEFICGQQIQFVIPVYQRNYDCFKIIATSC